jgi:glucose-1-phosphate thymidylyltransferase
MKGIVLAGGSGTRLYPSTRVVSKQLMPVYDKPLIYYPLSVLLLAGLRDILIISAPQELPRFQELLGDGSCLGIKLSYVAQPRPEGIAQAFLLAREFLNGDSACLILGDNIFYGHGFVEKVRAATELTHGAIVFAYWVADPERYGVVEFDADGRAVSLEEKPVVPRSSWAVPGLYFYDQKVCDLAAALKPSARGELEITDLNRTYLQSGDLWVERLGRGIAWLDTGTHESLLKASTFVEAIQERQGLMVACLEEIAYRQSYIGKAELQRSTAVLSNSRYGGYLARILEE